MATAAIVIDPITQKLTNIVKPRWKCPFCGATYKLCDGSRALAIDDRLNPEDDGEIYVLPLSCRQHLWGTQHPDVELEKQVEALIGWLRPVSLMDHLSVIDARTIRAAIGRTNFMAVNRLKASCSVVYKRTRNIVTEYVDYPTDNAKTTCHWLPNYLWQRLEVPFRSLRCLKVCHAQPSMTWHTC